MQTKAEICFHHRVFNHNIQHRLWKLYTDCQRASIRYILFVSYLTKVIFLFYVEKLYRGLCHLVMMETRDLIYPIALNKKTRRNVRNYNFQAVDDSHKAEQDCNSLEKGNK